MNIFTINVGITDIEGGEKVTTKVYLFKWLIKKQEDEFLKALVG